MTSRDIRRQFLDFFASKEHKIIASAPIVAKSDPTLMFINSGMAPLKDFFLGNQAPPAKRVADTQKCLRVTGKHNDLEDVGRDGYHHTMFEMLGNWSFGDYFKKEAIAWSWELLTEVYKLPKDRLYVSVFKGDDKEKLPFDQEAFDEWKKYIAEDRILAFGKKENFWEMGDQGPCGPCSEIHVDMRPDSERAKTDGRTLVNADDPNVIEVWNNVFMQFNRKADGSLDELPAKSVDTGMGFERLCRAVQGAASNYDTDLWKPLIGFLEKFSGIEYTGTYPEIHADWKKTDVAMRVVADHLRAVCFTIADGELPASGGAGYVIRRILRRAVRYYYSFLDLKEPVLYRMAPILAEEFHDVFPELKAQIDFVVRVILEEEKAFLRTLESGLKRIEMLPIQHNTIDGQQAFDLYDTFGFPIDLTRLIAREKGWSVDEAGFEKALLEQKTRSRKDAAKEVGDWISLPPTSAKGGGEAQSGGGEVEFVGYDQLELRDSHVVKYRTVQIKGQPQYHLVLNRTPFYPEGGGQVGDTGWLEFSLPVGEGRGGVEKIRVLDTKKENDLVMHVVERLPQYLQDPTVHCQVDSRKRSLTENNHSATHLLHAALRRVLGHHVQQKGSYLDDKTLRFDFAHFQKVTDEELAQIEQIVNEKIRENIALEEARNLPIEEAQKSGAMMLFGEKYGETVRMITFDPAYSRELCGGCHVRHTGQIGYFKIVSEGAVAAGVRRIEALTADAAEQYLTTIEREVTAIKMLLKTKEPAKAVADLQEENKRLQKEIERLIQAQADGLREGLRSKAETVNGITLVAAVLPIGDANAIKTLAYELERELGSAVIAFGSVSADKPLLTVRISEALAKERGLNAGTIVRELAQKFLQGGGGGQPFFATAGGSDASKLDEAVRAVKTYIAK
ncbi:MAG: alanine--tRNA ligase [Lewinellaceae bacterium]|nr:alanine--tRNA ligase [Lewinellaceae bacterium]